MSNDLYYSRDYHLHDPNGQRHRFGTIVKSTPETIDEIIATRNIGVNFHP